MNFFDNVKFLEFLYCWICFYEGFDFGIYINIFYGKIVFIVRNLL